LDLVGSWTLVDEDWRLVGNKFGPTRLGFALLLKFFELEARFPRSVAELPPAAVTYVAQQAAVEPETLAEYDWAGRAIKRHRVQIRNAFGFREFSVGDEDCPTVTPTPSIGPGRGLYVEPLATAQMPAVGRGPQLAGLDGRRGVPWRRWRPSVSSTEAADAALCACSVRTVTVPAAAGDVDQHAAAPPVTPVLSTPASVVHRSNRGS